MTWTSLTAAQLAFLASLRAGARPTSDCQDAIAVGELMRLNLVYWNEPRISRGSRELVSTFSLTRLGVELELGEEVLDEMPGSVEEIQLASSGLNGDPRPGGSRIAACNIRTPPIRRQCRSPLSTPC